MAHPLVQTPQPPYDQRRYTEEARAAQRDRTGKTQGLPKNETERQADEVKKRFVRLKSEAMKRRQFWIPYWQEIYDYTLPARESFFQNVPAEQHNDIIYDETAVQAIPRLASRLTAGYFPEYGEIFSLGPGPDTPVHLRGPEGQAKFNQLTAMIHASWQNSNLSAEISEGMIDLAIGTMNLCQEPGRYPGEVIFSSFDPVSIAILPGRPGEVIGWFTWHKFPVEDVPAIYRKMHVPEAMARDIKLQPRREVTVEVGTWRITDADTETYQFAVLMPDYDKCVYEERFVGEGSCPWSTTRWSKIGKDVWGRGPIQLTMPAIKTCNLTVQMILENAELALGGMWTYDNDGVFDPEKVNLQPGLFIPVAKGSEMKPLQSGTQFDVSGLVLNDMRANIKKGLFVDELDKQGETPYSAEEVQARRADIARDLTAPGGRITKECLVKQVNRTIWIFEKQGLLDSIGLRVDGKRIKLTVKSPFLRGQDAIVMNYLMTWAGQVNAIYGQGMAGMALRMDEGLAEITKRNGVDPRLVKSGAEIAKLIAQGTQGAAQVQQQTQQQAGDGAGAPGGGVDPIGTMAQLAKMGQ